MMSPSDSRRGSTGEHPAAGVPQPGSSIVQLSLTPHSDDRPTIITHTRSAAVANTVTLGQTLGHFELLEPIGRGGMATVLKARDLELGRIVALKILPPESAVDPDVVSRFKQEGRAAARLDHDHIARVYFCGEDRGLHFIAFEFVAGNNLRTVLDDCKRLAPADAVRYMIHVAAGLQHAAERGVVHRDIKPSNIIITPEGQAKIVDMGLARHLGSQSVNGGVTQSGVTLGTFDYISPEQALDPRQADIRSDIYSLGCTFYHALTGVPPVPDGTAARKLQAHQHDAPLDPRDHNPAVPDVLAAVLGRMMAKDPAWRHPTAAELLQDLAAVAFRCGMPVEGLPVDPTHPSTPRPLTPVTSRLPVAWLLTGSVAVIAVALILGQPNGRRTPAVAAWGDVSGPVKTIVEPATGSSARVSNDPSQKGIATAADLATACQSTGAVVARLRAGTTYELTTLAEGVAFEGTSFTLEADTTSGPIPPTVRIAAAALGENRTLSGGSLTFRNCEEVKFIGIRFVIVPSSDATPTMSTAAAIVCDKVGKLAIEGCRFTAEYSARDDQIAGLAILAPTRVTVRASLFDFGEQNTAFALRDAATLRFDESAFAPHRTIIDVRSTAATTDPTAATVAFQNSTAMIDRGGTAFRSSDSARLKVIASHSIFAGFDSADATGATGTLIVAEAAESPSVTFEIPPDTTNAIYKVAMQGPSNMQTATAFCTLARSPWASPDPRKLLGGSEAFAAFRLSLQDAKLRLPAASGAVILGVKSLGHPETRIYPGTWPPERPVLVKATANERIVWPDADADDAARRVYPTFAAAFALLEPGETLSLAVNGPLPIAPLADKTLKATVRALPGFKPILFPDGPAFTVDATLFKLADGEITFENLAFELKDRQSLVSAAGGTACTFRGCRITLREKDDHPAAAVVIPDPAREMKLPGSSGDGPRIRFENCVIRGDGRGVWVQAARGFELTFDNTALALDGSAVVIDPADKPAGTDVPKPVMKLRSVTAVLTGPLLEIKTGRATGGAAATVSLDAEQCLFAAADARGTATPLILLDDADAGTDLAKYLTWSGRGSIVSFSDGAAAVEWRGANDAMAGSWDWAAWLRFSRDDGRHLPRVRFLKGSLKSKLLTATAADFELSSLSSLDAGVDVKKLPE